MRNVWGVAMVVVGVLGGTPLCAQEPNGSADDTHERLGAPAAPAFGNQGEPTRDGETPSTPVARVPAANELASQIEALDQRVRILQRQLELEREQSAEASKTIATVAAGERGFSLRSGDGNFQLNFRTLLQADGRFFGGDRQDAIADTFVAQRVRPYVEATMYKLVDFRITPDFGQGRTVLQDAYVDVRVRPELRVRAGKFKTPFGLERLVSASDLPFVDRALPTTVAPNRDVGVMVHGDVLAARLSYAAGLFNGVVDGGSVDVDERDAKEIVGRLFAHPFRRRGRPRLEGVGIGLAATYGSQRGALTNPGLASYRTSGQVFFRYRNDGSEAGTVLADGDRVRVSAQGYYYCGRLGILAEQVFSSQQVRRATASTRIGITSWQVAGSWVLTGEAASYRGVTPRQAFDRQRGTWGAFELVARVGDLSVDRDAFPIFAAPASSSRVARTWAGGVNWYLNTVLKLSADYEQVRFTGGSATGARPAEHAFLSRIQFRL